MASLEVDGELWTTWEESSEQQIDLGPVALGSLVHAGTSAADETAITLEGRVERELLRDASGRTAGRVVRELRPVCGRIGVSASAVEQAAGLTRLRIRVENLTPWAGHPGVKRDEVVRNSLVAVHVLAAVDDGRFISMLDPPEHCRGAVASCRNIGGFPVLIGEGGADDVILSSPIILYDHPEVAPESQGDMFDATEIDEILALRILTLTEEEKREARRTDTLSATIIDRCDAMPPEVFERLHGAIRSLRPPAEPTALEVPVASPEEPVPWWDPEMDASVDPAHDTIVVGTVEVGKGAKVRLNPTPQGRRAGLLPRRSLGCRRRHLPRRRRRRSPRGRPRRRPGGGVSRVVRALPLLPSRRGRGSRGGVMTERVLVAGVGNIFLGDDGFGVAVASRMAGETFPEGVKVGDFGIRSVHLAYELLDGYDSLVLIDALSRGDPPGTLTVLEPELDDHPLGEAAALGAMDAHTMHPEAVLNMLSALGGQLRRVVVVGCEPALVEEYLGLSTEVAGAVDQAVEIVRDLVAELSTSNRKEGSP